MLTLWHWPNSVRAKGSRRSSGVDGKDLDYWLARIRRDLEAAGLPVERMTVVVAQPRPPRRVVRQPPPSHPMPLFEPAAGLSIRQGRAPPHGGER